MSSAHMLTKPVRRYLCPPEAVETIVLMLRRATQSGGPVKGKRLEYRRGDHVSGKAIVRFRVTDAKTTAAAGTAPADPADAAAAETEDLAARNDADAAAETTPEEAAAEVNQAVQDDAEAARALAEEITGETANPAPRVPTRRRAPRR